MNVSEFIIVTTKESDYGMTELKPHIVCNDGFKMSLQAGKGLYCNPRETAFEYTSVEIGFPSEEEDLIKQYAENKNDYTETVYPCTPMNIAEEVVKKHGGINVKKTFIKDE
tara:strand:+ start:208 stop:540 length:333 start_codon:yes stop_codon:yes gene_type:complete